jgi:PhnB protein
MIKLNPYLNFLGRTEEAFNFYKSVFGGEFTSLIRFRDSMVPDKDKIAEGDLDKIVHISLPIGQEILMGTDSLESQGHKVTHGNGISLCLSPDSREETERLFTALKEGGRVEMPLADMFWGDYFGAVEDKFGVNWMVACDKKA